MFKRKITKISFLLLLILTLHLPFTPMNAYATTTALDKVVVLETKGDYDELAAEQMRERIGRIHSAYLNVLAKENIVIKLINFPLTELEEYRYLKGEIPRGWEDTGYTWDDVPGAGGDPTVAKIGYSDPSPKNFHDSLNLELHEIAHAVDQFVFNEISYGKEFAAIHAAEQPLFLPEIYFEYVEEYFAEVFAYYYLSDETKEALKQEAPKTYAFFENLPKKIPKVKPPKLALNGDEITRVKIDDAYNEEGATASDDIYGDLSDKIKIDGQVDSSIPGEYEITYYVENEAGKSKTATRLINVVKYRIKDFIEHKKDMQYFLIQKIGKLKRA